MNLQKIWNRLPILLIVLALFSCESKKDKVAVDYSKLSWEQIEEEAKGTSATMIMYLGGKSGNKYMNEYVIPTLEEKYNITLNLVPGQGKEIIANILAEKEAGELKGQADLCWINGETFYQLRQIDGLYGPYNQLLPNFELVDYANPIIRYDFQEDIKGYETPWSLANFSVIYDSSKITAPPVSMADFERYWKQSPSRFTIPNDFSGLTLLKSWLIELAGGSTALDGKFDEQKYQQYSTQLWKWINANKKYFWKKGETFPSANTAVTQMFASGELDFAYSFANADIDIKIEEGVFPPSSRAFVLKAGSMQNANYIGIPYNAGNKAAALVVCNFLISPEAQAKKADLDFSGSRAVLDYNKLTPADKNRFDTLKAIKYGISLPVLMAKAIREPVPDYMIRVTEDFRKFVIEVP